AVTTRDFYQKNPERLRAGADGSVEIQFPAEPYTIYQAMGLEEEAVFYFHAADTPVESLQRVLEGYAKDQLLAVAPGPWMTASGALGELLAAGLTGAYANFDRFLEDSYRATVNFVNDGKTYGLLNYFDLPRYASEVANDIDGSGWGNSYYDPAGAQIHQFARTGHVRCLKDLATPSVRHFFSTDAYDTDDPDSYQEGISGAHGAYHRETWTGQYHYLESQWDYYYLTGDRRALERGV